MCRQNPREQQVCLHVSCFVGLRENCSIIMLQIFGCIVVPIARSGSIVQLRENCSTMMLFAFFVQLREYCSTIILFVEDLLFY